MYKPVHAIEARIWGETVGAVADRFGIGTAPQVLKQVGEAVSAWPDFAAQVGVGSYEVRRILEHHRVL